MSQDMTNILDWTHPTAAVPASGLELTRIADAHECRTVAEAADILGIDRLQARYRITQLARGRFLLAGEIKARAAQACVVTLDPVVADLVAPFSVEFWPAEVPARPASAPAPKQGSKDVAERKGKAKPEPATGDQEVFAEDEPERIENNAIDAGRIVYETFVTALDPYPRAPGAELELPDDAAGDATTPDHPFAALAKLKKTGD